MRIDAASGGAAHSPTSDGLHTARRRDSVLPGRGALRTALSRLWYELSEDGLSDLELSPSAKACEALVPREDDEPWIESQPCAEDAAAALVYALESTTRDGSQEAAWAARRAYEAVHHFLMSEEPGVIVTAAAESRVREHPLVQAELTRQRRDLDDLLAARNREVREVAARLRARAKAEAGIFFGQVS